MNRKIVLRKWFCRGTLAAAVIIAAGCKEQFPFPESAVSKNYLVVEGFINSGNDSTHIKLSRTVRPNDNVLIGAERSAHVLIESENGLSYPLTETKAGIYSAAPFAPDPAEKYRISIQTTNGKTYFSDFVEVRTTPLIDSINWTRTDDGIWIYVNTHDPQNATHYYTWQFDETWEIHSAYLSLWEYIDKKMVPRNDYYSLATCWQSASSTNILIGSSAKLTNDIIYRMPLVFMPDNSWRLDVKYSINVKQRALSRGAFEYLEKMKKNSEQLGSIFDPQPSTSSGNIYCSDDPGEMVIGYIYTSTVEEKRLFISRAEVPDWKYRRNCEIFVVGKDPDSLKLLFGSGGNLVIDEILAEDRPGEIKGYTGANATCIDCTIRGTNIKPDFWP